MKINLFLLVVVLCSSNMFPQYGQNFPIKQITSFNYDVRNPQFFRGGNYFDRSYLLFEAHTDSCVNIGMLEYNTEKDTFYNPIMLTNNDRQNINPVAVTTYYNNTVFYQTNINGTWDIAFVEFKNNQWSFPTVLVDSTGDEINPAHVQEYPFYQSSASALFEKNSSIYIISKTDSTLDIDTIYTSNDSLYYSQTTALLKMEYENFRHIRIIDCVAIETDKENQKNIVFITIKDGVKDSVKITIDSGDVKNPQYFFGYYPIFTYEKNEGDYNNIYYKDYGNIGIEPEKYFENPTGDISGFILSDFPPFITKRSIRKTNDSYLFIPHTYKLKRNDSTLISVQNYSNFYLLADSLVYTKVADCKPAVGLLEFKNGLEYYYYVWEDSINGKINLRGKKELYFMSAVESGPTPQDFQLYQNYPNPFNPSTKIRFYMPKSGFVNLIIYNILGEKVKTLVNDYMFSGEHEVEFSSQLLNKNFASGIYFYQFLSGNYSVVKKMILLK